MDDGEVDEYFFTEANAAELELFGKTMDVLAYARQPLPEARMPTQGSPIRRRERTGTHKTVGGGLEGEEEERKGDADTAIGE